jgi:hypothetical protein
MTKCKYCEYQHENGRKLAGYQSWCKYNLNRNRTMEEN